MRRRTPPYLTYNKNKGVPTHPCSSDSSPLVNSFPTIKSQLRRRCLQSVPEIRQQRLQFLHALPKHYFQRCFQHWRKHWNSHLYSEMEYFASGQQRPILKASAYSVIDLVRELLLMTSLTINFKSVCCIRYTGCPRRNVKYFGRVFLMLNYTDITLNTYIQS